MEDLAQSEPPGRIFLLTKNCDGAFHGEVSDADKPLWFEDANGFAQMLVASRKERVALSRWKFVGGAVPAGFLEKSKRAIVHDEMVAEKFFGGAEAVREQTPET